MRKIRPAWRCASDLKIIVTEIIVTACVREVAQSLVDGLKGRRDDSTRFFAASQ